MKLLNLSSNFISSGNLRHLKLLLDYFLKLTDLVPRAYFDVGEVPGEVTPEVTQCRVQVTSALLLLQLQREGDIEAGEGHL
jgi:hypothetical protein